jgi:hypothetical protein
MATAPGTPQSAEQTPERPETRNASSEPPGGSPETRHEPTTPDASAPLTEVLLVHAAAFEIPWPGHPFPLWLQRSYAGGDRWWIGDRDGRRWHREHGFVYESPAHERTRTDTRFPLVEAWPLAQEIAAGSERGNR